MKLPSREIRTLSVGGVDVDFIASNERLAERVESASNEDHVLGKLLEVADGTLWDVGACFGIHSFVAAQEYEFVRAWEPMPANRGAFVDNMHVNEVENVCVEPKALFDKRMTMEFAIRESEDAGYGRHSLDVGDYDNIRTIDVQTEHGDWYYEVPNVVKIDVEGAEGRVIEGMQDTLSHDDCQHVVVELHDPNPVQPSYRDFGDTLTSINQMLRECGFTLSQMEKPYHWYGRK